jgi:hypothetical protein
MTDDRLVALELAKLAMTVAPPLNEQEFFAMYRRCLTVIGRSAPRASRAKENGRAAIKSESRIAHELIRILEDQEEGRQ